MMAAPPRGTRIALVGCGILRAEIDALVERNDWPVDTKLLGAALHDDPLALARALEAVLARTAGPCVLVGYGACSPGFDALVARRGAIRLGGENCLAQLLGEARYHDALADGAYFLLERWARDWPRAMPRTFGKKLSVLREILHVDRRYLLAIETPCSGDFREAAERAARDADLPLRWTQVGLEPLERAIGDALAWARARAGDAREVAS
jgi:hypothetical protein